MKKPTSHSLDGESKSKTVTIIVVLAFVGVGGLVFLLTSANKAETAGVQLPSYAYATPELTQAYVTAVNLPDLFEHMPCYCGCANMVMGASTLNHKHLRNCFIKDDGSFEPHAAGCNTCVDIANLAYDMYKNNQKPIDIRNAIDQRYSTGQYPPPTKTLMPPV